MNIFYYLSTKQYIQGGPKTDCFLKFVTSVPQFAIHQILAFFVKNKTAIKINNLIVAHWLNILCKCCGIKWHHCYQRATLTSRSCLPALSSVGLLSTRITGQRIVSTSIQLPFHCGVLCHKSCIVKRSETLII